MTDNRRHMAGWTSLRFSVPLSQSVTTEGEPIDGGHTKRAQFAFEEKCSSSSLYYLSLSVSYSVVTRPKRKTLSSSTRAAQRAAA
jgi:hypothetical protein